MTPHSPQQSLLKESPPPAIRRHSAEDLRKLLGSYRFRFSDEAGLQAGIEKVLQAEGVAYHREHALGAAGRVDFMVGTVGIEVKVDGTFADILRQASRYLEREDVDELLLIGTPRVLNSMPRELGGKPLVVYFMVQAFL